MSGKKALVILSPGAEEMETVISVDVLRRAKISVTLAGIASSEPVTCSRDVRIVPDMSLEEAATKGPYDVIVLPGGLGGSKKLAESQRVKELLEAQEKSGQYIAAVCAAPSALLAHGIAKVRRNWRLAYENNLPSSLPQGKQLTSHPCVQQQLEESGQYSYSEARVCCDGTIITSRGPGSCFEFALAIVSALVGEQVAMDISGPMMLPKN